MGIRTWASFWGHYSIAKGHADSTRFSWHSYVRGKTIKLEKSTVGTADNSLAELGADCRTSWPARWGSHLACSVHLNFRITASPGNIGLPLCVLRIQWVSTSDVLWTLRDLRLVHKRWHSFCLVLCGLSLLELYCHAVKKPRSSHKERPHGEVTCLNLGLPAMHGKESQLAVSINHGT